MIEVMIEPQLQTNTTARCVAQDDCSTVGAGLLVSSGSASSISPGFHPDLRIRNITDTDNYGEQHTQFYMEGKTAVVTAVAPGKCLAAVLCTPETGCGGVLGPNETAWTLLFSAEMSPESSGGVVPPKAKRSARHMTLYYAVTPLFSVVSERFVSVRHDSSLHRREGPILATTIEGSTAKALEPPLAQQGRENTSEIRNYPGSGRCCSGVAFQLLKGN